MKVIINAFQESDRDKTKEFIENLILQLSTKLENKLDLSSLEYFIVPKEFGTELLQFQEEHGLPLGYSNDEYGTAYGKNLTYEKNGDLTTSIFIDHSIVSKSASEDKNDQQFSAHLIHHELCHAHDEKMKVNMIGLEFVLKDRGDFQTLLKIYANHVWSEYIANRLSASTIPLNHDLRVPYFYTLIKTVKENIEACIKNFQTHGNHEQLFSEIQMHSTKLLYFAATVFGYLHGLNFNKYEAYDLINKQINETYFGPLWNELGVELNDLYDTYSSWNSVEIFDKLGSIVLRTWEEMGFNPRVFDNDDISIDGP